MVSIETIGEQFAELGIEPAPAILGKCLDLCTTYSIEDPVEFVEQWMAFSVSHLGGAEPTVSNLGDMERKELAPNQGRSASAAPLALAPIGGRSLAIGSPQRRVFGGGREATAAGAASGSVGLTDDGGDDFMDSYITRTPKAANRTQSRLQHNSAAPDSPATCASPLTGKTVASYVSGQAIYTFGTAALVKNTTWSATSKRRIAIRHLDQSAGAGETPAALSSTDKYMFDTLLEKSLSAADRLYDIGHQICVRMQADRDAAAANNSPAEESDAPTEPDESQQQQQQRPPETGSVFDSLVHPDVASQQPVLCVGRICSDAPDAPKLTASSVLLCSTDDRRARTVRLNLSQQRSFALFPGQTVAVRGRNPRGDTLYVDQVFAERQLPAAPPPPPVQRPDEAPLTVLVASGPYTLAADLAYEPLHALLAYCADNRPDVLFLCGPFVEAEHSMLVDGVLQETFEVFFERIVAEVMAKVGADTQVVLVASGADVLSTAVWPTHPLPVLVRGQWPNLLLVGDPCVLSVAGWQFAVGAADVLRHLTETECAHNAGERIKRAVNYMFHQGSFYPLDPPHPDLVGGVDSELAAKYAQLRTVPHVLLLPSDLKCFVRDIGGCLVVNPGRLTEPRARGTFARLVIGCPAGREQSAALATYMACQVVKM